MLRLLTWPFRMAMDLIGMILGMTGRLAAFILGGVICCAGVALCLTGIGLLLGVPMVIIGAGMMMAGLLANAGVGLLVLFRLNKNSRQNFEIVCLLYVLAVVWGLFISMTGIQF